jgi:hypothetical protein
LPGDRPRGGLSEIPLMNVLEAVGLGALALLGLALLVEAMIRRK